MDDIIEASERIDALPVNSFMGMKVIENPLLEPNEIVIIVGSQAMRKIKEQRLKEREESVNEFWKYMV